MSGVLYESAEYYYHYITLENATKIWDCKELKPSTNVIPDCPLDGGIYLTTISHYPFNPKRMFRDTPQQ